MTDTRPPTLRLVLILMGAAIPGLIAATLGIPETLAAVAGVEVPDEPWWVYAASIVQTTAMVGLAAWGGAVLAPRVGLKAPAAEALARRQPVGPALRPQWVPGLLGGLAGTALLVGVGALAPAEIAAVGERVQPSLAMRVLYGGITEEVLVRWGVMTALVALLWRVSGRHGDRPAGWQVVGAILVSALLFGLGHLPIVSAMVETVTPSVVAYIVLGNGAFGILAGWLYWRWGLESAILAHMGAHLGTAAIAALLG
ncbi:MAG: CPBP family intramembrane glutamic endopeptidase [Bacteroidota bacterium]